MADVDTSKIDFERMSMLLDVVHKCAGVGPKLTSLANAAMTELTKTNDSVRVASMEAERERREAEAAATPRGKTLTPLTSNEDPTEPDPDDELVDEIRPRSIPSGEPSIADRRI